MSGEGPGSIQNPYSFNSRSTRNPIQNWEKDSNRHFSKEDNANGQLAYDKSFGITSDCRKHKTTVGHHVTPRSITVIKQIKKVTREQHASVRTWRIWTPVLCWRGS